MKKKNKKIFSMISIGVLVPFTITTLLTSCKSAEYKVDLSKINFTSFSEGLPISANDPHNVTFYEINDKVSSSNTLKQYVSAYIENMYPDFFKHFSYKDINVEIENIAPQNLNDDMDLVNPTYLDYLIKISSSNKKIENFAEIPAKSLTIQAIPQNVEWDMSDFKPESIEPAEQIYVNDFKQVDDDLVETILSADSSVSKTSIRTIFQENFKKWMLDELIKKSGIQYNQIVFDSDLYICFQYSTIEELTYSQIINSQKNPLDVQLGAQINHDVCPYRFIPNNLFAEKLENLQFVFGKFSLSNLEYINGNTAIINATNNDFENNTIAADQIKNSIRDMVSSDVDNLIRTLPTTQKPTSSDYSITFPDVTDWQNFSEDTERVANVVVSATIDTGTNPLCDSYTFPIKYKVVDNRNKLNDKGLVKKISQQIESLDIAFGDVVNPTNVQINELRNEIPNNNKLIDAVYDALKKIYPGVKQTDFSLDLYSNDSPFCPVVGNYSETVVKDERSVYFLINSTGSSSILSGSTGDSSITEPLKISAYVDDTQFDLSTLGPLEFYTKDNPAPITTPHPAHVTLQDFASLIGYDKGDNLFGRVMDTISEKAPAAAIDDFVIEPQGDIEGVWDLSTTKQISFKVCASSSTQILKNSDIITAYVVAKQSDPVSIKDITVSYLPTIQIPTTSVTNVIRSEITSGINSKINDITDVVNDTVKTATSIDSLEYKTDYDAIISFPEGQQTWDLSGTKQISLEIRAKEFAGAKIKDSLTMTLNIIGQQIQDKTITYSSSIRPNIDGSALSHDFCFNKDGIFNVHVYITINFMNIRFQYSENSLQELAKNTSYDTNITYSLDDLMSKNIIIGTKDNIYGWLTGSFSTKAYDKAPAPYTFDETNGISYAGLSFYEKQKPDKVSLGFCTGERQNGAKDSFFDAFRFHLVYDGASATYKLGYIADGTAKIIWGADNHAQMYKNSKKRIYTTPKLTSDSESNI